MRTMDDPNTLKAYEAYLWEEERSDNTIRKYLRDIRRFLTFAQGNPLDKSLVLAYKETLIGRYADTSVNSMLAAVNNFLVWVGAPQCKVKPLKIQRDIFLQPEKELSKQEYQRLVCAAEQKKNRKLAILIQTICATGIRVSELPYITVESLAFGRANVSCKGKNRVIFLPKNLCKCLKKYCRAQNLCKGSIFLSKTGKPLDRSNIWRMMKNLCQTANVAPSKVFPHNLRHLFARCYYKIEKDIGRLADILGHSSINTTRIYIMETGKTHAMQIDRMHLVDWAVHTT